MTMAPLTHTEVAPLNESEKLELFMLDHPAIEFFRFYWVDLVGTTRVRIVTLPYLRQLLQTNSHIGVGISVLSMIQSSALNGSKCYGVVGQVDVVPDISSLRACDYAPSHASLMCTFAQNRQEFELSSRYILQRMIELSSQRGLNYLFGFEVEFTLSNKVTAPNLGAENAEISPNHTWASARALSGCPMSIIEAIVQSLQRSGIEVQHFEAEGGPAQYEIATGPLPSMAAIDALIHSRETIHHICDRYSTVAHFHPKLKPNVSGTGAHVHFSMDNLSLEDSFIAGILYNLPAICAFSVPTVVSYDRLLDFGWAGGTWVAWGTQNRETPLRKISPGHWEFKCLDGTANVYLALAAMVAGGLDGVMKKMALSAKDCQSDPASLSSEERNELGISVKLPNSVEAGLASLKDNSVMRDAFGEKFIGEYVAIKEEELRVISREGKEWYTKWY